MNRLAYEREKKISAAREALRAAGEAQRAALALLEDVNHAPPEVESQLYYTDDDNPIGTGEQCDRWRAWLARSGVQRFKVGQRTLALRAEVDATIQARPLRRRVASTVASTAAERLDVRGMLAGMIPDQRSRGRRSA